MTRITRVSPPKAVGEIPPHSYLWEVSLSGIVAAGWIERFTAATGGTVVATPAGVSFELMAVAALSFVSATIQTATRLIACASFSASPRPASSWVAVLLVALAGPGLARAGSFREEIAESILKARRVERERVQSYFAQNSGLRFSRPPSWRADTGSGFSIDTGPSGRHQTAA